MPSFVELSENAEKEIRECLSDENELYRFEPILRRVMKRTAVGISGISKEDLTDEIFVYVVTNRQSFLAKNISFKSYLSTLITKLSFSMLCEKIGVTERDYRNYLKTKKCCEEYGISMVERNAYKVSALTDLSIADVISGIGISGIVDCVSFTYLEEIEVM